MRPRFHSEPGPNREGEGRPVELVRVRRAQRESGPEGFRVRARARRRGGRGRRRSGRNTAPPAPKRWSFLGWLKSLFGAREAEPRGGRRSDRRDGSLDQQEARVLAEFMKQYGTTFRDPGLLKLALTHRSYLSVTGQGPRESNERLEFLGDSVLGLVTSEYLYRRHPDEHEGQLTKTKSLLVSKAILSRRALRMGLGRYVLMSHSEVESGGRQRLSILADAFESVLGAIYLDQGFETARKFIHQWLLAESDAIVSDKRHTNYKSHLQEYVQSTYRTHPVYRIRSEYGPDHSKHFMVEVMVGRRTLGEGRGHNKKEAEQAAARDALEKVEKLRRDTRAPETREGGESAREAAAPEAGDGRRRRGRRSRRRDADAVAADEPRALLPVEPERAFAADEPEWSEAEADEPIDAEDEATDDEEVVEVYDDADDQDDDADDSDEDDLDEVADSEDVDDDEDDDDGEDDEEDEEDEEDDDVAGLESEPVPARPAASPAPGRASQPAAPVSYGRSSRRAGTRPATGPAPAAPVVEEPVAPNEEALIDPFGHDEAPPPAVIDVAVEPEMPEAAEESEDRDARIEEIERAMANFGQQRYGRKGRRR